MKAYCFRSGHVMLGLTVPAGAIELADHPDEGELLLVIRWNSKVIEEDSGVPTMVLPGIVESRTEMIAAVKACEARRNIQCDLKNLQTHPVGRTLFTVRPPMAWSLDSLVVAERYA